MTLLDVEIRLRQLSLRYTRHGDRIRAQCPCHHDRDPSLIIDYKGGRIRVKCFAGCDGKLIMQVLSNEAERPASLPDLEKEPDIDVSRGLDLLTDAWQNIDTLEQPLTAAELKRRGIPMNPYKVVDAQILVETIKRRSSRSDLIQSGLAYEKDGKLVFRHVFDNNRVVIPYMRGERVVSIRSRRTNEESSPKYLSLKGYPTRAYIARATPGTILLVVEGEFKAMVLAEHLPEEISVIALPGVTAAWSDLQSLCDRYAFWRKFVLFDSESDNKQVDRAAGSVAGRIGGDLLRIELMDGEKRIAPDDFVLRYGAQCIADRLLK